MVHALLGAIKNSARQVAGAHKSAPCAVVKVIYILERLHSASTSLSPYFTPGSYSLSLVYEYSNCEKKKKQHLDKLNWNLLPLFKQIQKQFLQLLHEISI